ncbi:MAG: hypothetical protein K6A43_05500 [Treponema sp.]|nr:hypothetical protein [Treponema sp.]
MEQNDMLKNLLNARNSDESISLETKIEILEHYRKNVDLNNRELVDREFDALAKEVADRIEMEKGE